MRNYAFPLAAILALTIVVPSRAAEKPRPAQADQTRKVWTNDDMDGFRARDLISTFNVPTEAAAPAPAAPVPAETAGVPSPVYESRLDDPAWYAEKVAELQAELDKRAADLQQQQDAMALVKSRVTQPGVAMDRPSAGVTPEAGLVILEARVQEIQTQLDDLGDLARQHDIAPAVLRS